MFFMLEKKNDGCFSQLGIVVATSIQEAAARIGARIVEEVHSPESAIACAELEDNYWLEEFPEITAIPTDEKPASADRSQGESPEPMEDHGYPYPWDLKHREEDE